MQILVFSYLAILFFVLFSIFSGKFTTSISTFATSISQLSCSHFPWKMISIGCLIPLTSVLNYSHIVNFLFIFWWTLKQLVSNSQLYLIFILLLLIINICLLFFLIIHVFAIFHRNTDICFLYIHLSCFGIKIAKQCFFSLHSDAL